VTCIGSLLDTLKLHRVALVGNSMGGFWALAFALARPERVSKLVFLGEVAGSSPHSRQSRYCLPHHRRRPLLWKDCAPATRRASSPMWSAFPPKYSRPCMQRKSYPATRNPLPR